MRRTACAISTPTGPPPSTSRRRGTSVRPVASRFVQMPSSSRRPGTGGITASEPVAITTWSAECGSSSDLHAAGAGQPGGAAQHLDPLRLEVLRLGAVLVARHHEVAPSERALGVDAAAHGLARARRLARRLERLARAQQRLRRDAGPVVALAADQLALDDRHAQAAVGQVPRAVLARRARSDHDRVVVAHARASRALSISQAAVIRPMWLNACGKLPSCSPFCCVDLLGQQAEVVRVAGELVEQRLGALELARLRQARDEPERADHERALLAGQPVGVEPLVVAVAEHEAVLGQLRRDRLDRRAHALVGRRAGSRGSASAAARRRARPSRTTARTPASSRSSRARARRRGSRRARPPTPRSWRSRRAAARASRRGRAPSSRAPSRTGGGAARRASPTCPSRSPSSAARRCRRGRPRTPGSRDAARRASRGRARAS